MADLEMQLDKPGKLEFVPAPQPITFMELIHQAVMNKASVEQVNQLFELKLRVDADNARNAFNEAFAAFKAEAVTVLKNVQVSDGPLKGKFHADLYGVVSVVTPALSKHRLGHSWKLTRDEKDWIEVTCYIKHALGHVESVSMGAAPDTGPGRNAIQARASTISYLERYTFMAATGMAATGQDNDGNGGGPEMDEKDYISWMDAIENASDVENLRATFKAAFTAADDAKDTKSKDKFIAAKDKRKKQLTQEGK